MPAKEYTVDAPTWVDLTSSDANAVIPFYEKLFGWTSEGSDAEYGGYVTFRRDGVSIAGLGGQMPGTTRANVWNTYIASADAQATVAAAEAAGGDVIMPAMTVGDQGTMAIVANPGGAFTGIWQAGVHRGYGAWGEHGTPVWHEEFTRNFAPTLEFYRSVFGWQFEVLGDSDEFRYSQASLGGDTIAGIMDASAHLPADTPSHWRVYFGVDDTDAAVASAIELWGAPSSTRPRTRRSAALPASPTLSVRGFRSRRSFSPRKLVGPRSPSACRSSGASRASRPKAR